MSQAALNRIHKIIESGLSPVSPDNSVFEIDNSLKSCQAAYKKYKDWCAQSGRRPDSYSRFRRVVLNKRRMK